MAQEEEAVTLQFWLWQSESDPFESDPLRVTRPLHPYVRSPNYGLTRHWASIPWGTLRIWGVVRRYVTNTSPGFPRRCTFKGELWLSNNAFHVSLLRLFWSWFVNILQQLINHCDFPTSPSFFKTSTNIVQKLRVKAQVVFDAKTGNFCNRYKIPDQTFTFTWSTTENRIP